MWTQVGCQCKRFIIFKRNKLKQSKKEHMLLVIHNDTLSVTQQGTNYFIESVRNVLHLTIICYQFVKLLIFIFKIYL